MSLVLRSGQPANRPTRKLLRAFAGVFALLASACAGEPSTPVPVPDGGTVVLVGDGIVAGDRAEGWLAAALLAGHPGAGVQVRNLGWSGDRLDLGARPDGLRRLSDQLAEAKPALTLLIAGSNDAVAPDGAGERLAATIAALAPAAGRLVLCTPPPTHPAGRPAGAPDPGAGLAAVAQAVRAGAATAKLTCIDLHGALAAAWQQAGPGLTRDGLRPDGAGYLDIAGVLIDGLGWRSGTWTVAADIAAGTVSASGATIAGARCGKDGVVFTATPLAAAAARRPVLRVAGLPPGRWSLSSAGCPPTVADAAAWAAGVAFAGGLAIELRQRCAEAAFWRARSFHPENWHQRHLKYLAESLPGYAVHAARLEAEALALRAPRPQTWTLMREGER